MSEYEFHPFSLKDRVKSFTYAVSGIRLMIASQHNAWIHLVATLIVLFMGFIFKITGIEWALLLIAIASVWIAETLNTAFEFLCDVASPEFHPLVEKAKDVSAGAVLIAALTALTMGIAIFAPYIIPPVLAEWYHL